LPIFSNLVDLVARQNWASNGVDCYVVERDPNDPGTVVRVAAPIVTYEIKPGKALNVDPTFRLSRQCAQRLADALWFHGFRPSEAAGSAGALAQAEAHIKSLKATNESLLALLKTRPSA